MNIGAAKNIVSLPSLIKTFALMSVVGKSLKEFSCKSK